MNFLNFANNITSFYYNIANGSGEQFDLKGYNAADIDEAISNNKGDVDLRLLAAKDMFLAQQRSDNILKTTHQDYYKKNLEVVPSRINKVNVTVEHFLNARKVI